MNASRPQRSAWILVAVFATTLWLLPLVLVWWSAQDPRRALRRAARDVVPPPQAPGPLILYADSWPTRETIDLVEIQGKSEESDIILGPKVIASDLSLALRQLGVTSESRRLDSIADPAELLTHREIVLVYPTRHGEPPWQVMQFVDHQLEALVARQDPALAKLQLRDVAIAEGPAHAAAAQAALAATMAYYHLDYHPGPALVEAMNSIVIYRRLQDLAAQLPAQGVHHD